MLQVIQTIHLFKGISFEAKFVDGKLWFIAKDVCDFLEFSNVSRTVKEYCREWHYKKWHFGGDGRPALYLTLAGVIRLCLRSKNPNALDFQDWVTDDVLPEILLNNIYISPEATKEDVIKAAQERGIELALEINDQQALLAYNAQLQNRCIDFDGLEQPYLSISQVLEKQGYKLDNKLIDSSLAQIGKQVKKAYMEDTGNEPKITKKQVGSNHGTEIKSYPEDFWINIEMIARTYWIKKGILELTKHE